MSAIALVTADKVEIVRSLEQLTLPAAEAITAGMAVRFDTSTGKFTKANGSTAAEARVYGIAARTVPSGMPVTAIRKGIMDGWDLSGMSYDDSVFLSDTDGRLDTAAGTVDARLGKVIAGTSVTNGTAYDKLFYVDCSEAEDSTLDSLTVGGALSAGATTVTDLTVTGNTLLGNNAAVDTLTVTADITEATGVVHAITDADALTEGGIIIPQHLEVTFEARLNDEAVDAAFFIANRAYEVVAVREIHAVAGDDVGAVNAQVTKDTGTQAPGAGANLLTNNASAGFDLKGTANTVQAGTLTATGADLILAAGNRLSVDFAGTVATLAGMVITVTLKRV